MVNRYGWWPWVGRPVVQDNGSVREDGTRVSLMKIRLTPQSPSPVTPQALAAELVERCYPPLTPKPWPDRLAALMEVHDQLRDDVPDFAVFCEFFPLFIEKLIDRFGDAAVGCFEQAQIYANSARPGHREAAGEWLRRHANQKSRHH